AFGAVLMLLWNWLVPGIFGWAAINYWQALGLWALARILFGSGVGRHWMRTGMHHHHFNPIREKWMKMSDEERKEFLKKHRHCHPFGRACREDFFQQDEPAKPE
ncbi:MAG: hypothetical protein LBG77_03170, partial [Dysgonamonadaceae bacterium]|nr:hypothetical protein [Dysgonamonadaceae bacterium]